MVDIRFDEDSEFQRSESPTQGAFLVRLMLKTGVVSDERSAERIFIIIAILGIILSVMFILFSLFGHKGATSLSNADIERITNLQRASSSNQ